MSMDSDNPYQPPSTAAGVQRGAFFHKKTNSVGYVFNENENTIIRKLAGSLKFVSYTLIVGAGLLTLLLAISCFGLIATPLTIAVIFLGVVGLRASNSFSVVTENYENGIPPLHEALQHLNKFYGIWIVVAIVGVLGSIARIVVALN